MPEQDVVRVTDPQALRALSHPLRLKLLGLLRLDGPSTATLLGRRLGESSGATSYHLRELERFGFVAEDPGRGTGRERWWQAVHRMTDWAGGDFAGEDQAVVEELNRALVQRRGRLLAAWLEQQHRLDEDWRDSGHLNDYALRLTPEQAAQLNAELCDVVDRWAQAHPTDVPAAGTRLVSVLVDLFPLEDWPL